MPRLSHGARRPPRTDRRPSNRYYPATSSFARQRAVPELSVVIPLQDEAANVGPLVREIDAALGARFDYEIVCVDDASRDDTVGALRRVRDELRLGARLRVLRHARARGQSTAVWTGVRAARGRLIATLDGDGQNDPADIPKLVAVVATDAGAGGPLLAVGHRTRRVDHWLRRVSSRIANGVRARLLKDGTPDTGCGLKVLPRAVFVELPYFDHMHRFMPALVRRHGGEVVSVAVNHRPRLRGTSKYGVWNRLWVGIVDLFGVAWLAARERRTRDAAEVDLDVP